MLNIVMAALIAFSVGCSVPSITVKDNASGEYVKNYACAYTEEENLLKSEKLGISTEVVQTGPQRSPVIAPLTMSTTYDSFMQAYFRGLGYTENIGENRFGSCTYVALGMVLSYYDSYLNDSIVPEKYDIMATATNVLYMDQNSPGVLNDSVGGSLSKYEYLNVMKGMAEVSLHSKLLSIGDELGYNDMKLELPFGLSLSDARFVLFKYLSQLGFSQENDYAAPINSGSDVENFIKQKIDNGFPVLLSVKSGDAKKSHTVVAYDYDSSHIYVHMGWTGSTGYAHVALDGSGFPVISSAMVVRFFMSHTHSRNYRVKTGTVTKNYCYCEAGQF